MVVAYLPSPPRGTWQLGPIPLRAYALCLVLGIVAAVWLANRRYLRIGGRPGVILDAAIWAVPFGLAGARLYSVITDYELYVGPGRDLANVLRIWDGGLGIPGGIAAGALGAWLACRRAGVALGPVAGAAAPAVAAGQAIGCWGNWFSQELYGRPSTLPWAVEIAPAHRLPGYESYATFQPAFMYESLWDLAVAGLVIWAARRFRLPGGRVFAVYAGSYAVGRYGTESLRIDYAHHLFGLRLNQWLMIVVFLAAAGYLRLTRHKRGPDVIGPPAAALPGPLVSLPPGVTLPPGLAAGPGASASAPVAPVPPQAPHQDPSPQPADDHIECF